MSFSWVKFDRLRGRYDDFFKFSWWVEDCIVFVLRLFSKSNDIRHERFDVWYLMIVKSKLCWFLQLKSVLRFKINNRFLIDLNLLKLASVLWDFGSILASSIERTLSSKYFLYLRDGLYLLFSIMVWLLKSKIIANHKHIDRPFLNFMEGCITIYRSIWRSRVGRLGGLSWLEEIVFLASLMV